MIGPEILTLDEVDSTNTFLKQNPQHWSQNFFTVRAIKQTGGRGRLGRTWHSGADDLTFSFVFRPSSGALYRLSTIYAGIAVCRALKNYCNIPFEIKWPNDIVYEKGEKLYKLGGILTELVFEEKSGAKRGIIIAGIGININSETFPEEIDRNPVSLKTLTKKSHSPETVLSAILSEAHHLFPEMKEEMTPSLRDEWTALSNSCGKKIHHTFNNGQKEELLVKGLSLTGELIANTLEGESRLITDGEIEYLS